MIVGLRKHLVGAIALASLVAFSAPGLAQAATRTADVAAHHSVKRHARHRPHIAQHNGGDRDGDNNGARSDGDGNV